MGSEAAEPEPSSLPKLPLLTLPPMQSPDHRSGMLTPPLHPSATVPFRWEEQPGKPLHCTALILSSVDPNNTSTANLELPPRLQSKMTKMPSPTTVLDGPYPVFQSSSFRFKEKAILSFGGSPERGQLGAMVLGKLPAESKERGGWFGSWGRKGTTTLFRRGKKGKGSFDFSTSVEMASFGDDENGSSTGVVKMSRIRRNGSFSSLSQARPHFWASIYESFKQVLPWSKKSKKGGLVI